MLFISTSTSDELFSCINIDDYTLGSNTNNMEVIKACQSYFSFKLPSVFIPIRVDKFTARAKAI